MTMLHAAMIEHLDLLIASMAALSIFLACVLVFWPYLAKDTLGVRMRQLAGDPRGHPSPRARQTPCRQAVFA